MGIRDILAASRIGLLIASPLLALFVFDAIDTKERRRVFYEKTLYFIEDRKSLGVIIGKADFSGSYIIDVDRDGNPDYTNKGEGDPIPNTNPFRSRKYFPTESERERFRELTRDFYKTH